MITRNTSQTVDRPRSSAPLRHPSRWQTARGYLMRLITENDVPSRTSSIDVFRSIAAFVVVILHAHPFEFSSMQYPAHESFFDLLKYTFQNIRFVIPFFFMAGGYFYGQRLRAGHPPQKVRNKYLRRIAGLWLFWCLVYLLVPQTWLYDTVTIGVGPAFVQHWAGIPAFLAERWNEEPSTLFTVGTSGHLWFLSAYIVAISFFAAMVKSRNLRYALPVAAAVFLVGLLGWQYRVLPFGLKPNFFDAIKRPCMGPLFFVLGWILSDPRRQPVKWAVPLMLLGVSLQFLENVFLWKFYGLLPRHEYYLGSVPLGLGVMLFALRYPDLGKGSILASLGRLTLGIYVTHILFIDGFRPFRDIGVMQGGAYPLLWDVSYTFLVYGCAILLTLLIRRVPGAKKLVV